MNLLINYTRFGLTALIICIMFYGILVSDVQADDIRVEGNIQHLGTDSLTVNNIIFYVDVNTEIRDQHGASIQFTELQIGDLVEVRADFTAGGYYLATRIELEDRGEELEVEGYIQEIYPDSLRVSGIMINVDTDVEVRGEHGQTLVYSDLTIGHFVEVRAELRGLGNYFAYRIDLEHDGDEIEFKGIIDAIGTNSITVNTVIIEVGGDTQIRGSNNQVISLNDLMVGDEVEVKARLMPSGIYHATRIKLEDELDDEIELKAPIDSIYADTLLVAGVEFWVDTQTVIMGDNQQPLNYSDLSVGFIVEIKGTLLADGTVYAYLIKVEDFWQEEIEITGEITSIGNDWLMVTDLLFYVDANTIILNDDNLIIPFSSLQTGQIVEVKAIRRFDGSLLAIRIKLERRDGRELEMKGFIENINSGSLQISGIIFNINTNTAILNHANQPISLNELEVDNFVEVKAFLQTDNSYLATRIKVENDPNFVKVSGTISTVQSNTVYLSSTPVQLNSETIVINNQYGILSISDILEGQQITIWADYSQMNSLQALQIRINGGSGITGVKIDGENGISPSSFELNQNYPNPFNPTTTISFTLQNSADVTLIVYNVLGEKLAVLINGQTSAGTHSVSFDAQQIPSGYYFYTLTVEGNKQTRKMLLMR